MRTMLMSTAAIGLVATLLTVPAQRRPRVSKGLSRRLLQERVRVQRTSPLYARG